MSKDSKPRTEWIPNFTYGEISVGQSARLLRTLTPKDILNASAVCTDTPSSPALVTHSSVNVLNDVLAHGVWAGTQSLNSSQPNSQDQERSTYSKTCTS